MAKKKTTQTKEKTTVKKSEEKKTTTKKVVVKKSEPTISEERYNQLNRVVVGRPLTAVEIIALFEREVGGKAKIEKPNAFQISVVVKGIRFPKVGHYTCK